MNDMPTVQFNSFESLHNLFMSVAVKTGKTLGVVRTLHNRVAYFFTDRSTIIVHVFTTITTGYPYLIPLSRELVCPILNP